MYCINENSTKKFICNTQYIIDLITIEVRFFESQQYAVIQLRKWHSCL